MKKSFFLLVFLWMGSQVDAQDSIWQKKPEITFSGYVDVFYAYDFGKPLAEQRQAFLFHHNRHNEFNLNLGLLSAKIEHEKYRASLGLQAGTYAQDNYALEAPTARPIYEAQIGIALDKAGKLWLDAGIFPSHLGFESAISMDNFTLTRSLAAENSPYFLSGAKMTYQANEKWTLTAVATNGWQRIRRVEGNSLLSWGTQVVYQPSENVTWNWSTFVGTDDADNRRRMRYFNDFYGIFKLNKRTELIAGFDFGVQDADAGQNRKGLEPWSATSLLLRSHFSEKWKMGFRAEYFTDPYNIIVPTFQDVGFQTFGQSVNLDFVPNGRIAWRTEARLFTDKNAIFFKKEEAQKSNFFFVTSLAVKL